MTGLLPRGQRIDAIEKRLDPRRANHRCVVLNFFLAACTNSPDAIGAASCVGHLSFTFSDTHVPYVFLEATRTSEMARPTRQPGVSSPYHRDRSHHARDYWLENGVRTRSSTECRNSQFGMITAPAPALSSTQRPPPIQRSQENSNQTPTQTSHTQATPRISLDLRLPQLGGTTCGVARASRGDIYPATVNN